MNAKKIMGAVLVALLAAALFVGAGAAADATYTSGKTVFVYQNLSSDFSGEWTNGVDTITAVEGDGNYYFSGKDIVEGKYTQGPENSQKVIYVKYPTVTVNGVANDGEAAYLFIGGNLYTGADPVTVTVASPTSQSAGKRQCKPVGICFPERCKVRRRWQPDHLQRDRRSYQGRKVQ